MQLLLTFRKPTTESIEIIMLFSKLSALGLKGNFYESMKAIYSNVRCSVKVNGVLSDSFYVSSGLKQVVY